MVIIVDPNDRAIHKEERKNNPGAKPLNISAENPNKIGPKTPPTSPAVKYSPPAAPVFSPPTIDINVSMMIGITPLDAIPRTMSTLKSREFSK